MYKQSTYVIALFLGTSKAFIETPESNSYFATGMNGDEDLGEDITMKGNKFHFIQQQNALAQEDPAKTEKVETLEPEKVHTLDPKIAKSHTTFYNRDNLVQLEGEGEGEGNKGYPRPEQVHNLDPMVYTNISNMKNYSHVLNPSNGYRTAFYDKQNNDQVSDMQLLQETPAIHPYNYDPWVYQFSKQNIRPYSGHINEDPEESRPKSQEEVKAYKDLLAQGLVEPTEMELYICNSDGSDLRKLTDLGNANWSPFFHPSGEKILFSSNFEAERGFPFNLYMIDLDGKNLKRITHGETFDAFPVFSNDGKWLAFSSNRNNGGGRDTNLFIAEWQE